MTATTLNTAAETTTALNLIKRIRAADSRGYYHPARSCLGAIITRVLDQVATAHDFIALIGFPSATTRPASGIPICSRTVIRPGLGTAISRAR